jgi:EmrB/QacA subfamily drug resistance transporter
MPAQRSTAFALVLICAAQFVLQLDFSIVNVALPSIQRELGMAAAQLQWIVTGYALTFGSLLLVGGRAADVLERRRLLVFGLALFGVASLASGLAQSPLLLIVARALQGVGGAMTAPAALSLLTTMHPEGPARNRALSIWQATTSAGATAGIVAGGLLTEYFGWRGIFLVNPPLIAIMLLLVPRLLPSHGRTARERVDVLGALLITGALAALIFGLSEGEQYGFTSLPTVVALAGAFVFGAAFVVTERAVVVPMLPFRILAVPTRRAAVIAMLLMGGILAAYLYFISLYLQGIQGLSPLLAGLALVPATVTVVLTSTLLTRRLLARFGVKALLLVGLACIAIGQFWLAHISAGDSYVSGILPGVLLTAFGLGLAFPTVSIAVTSGVEQHDQGLAGALFVTSQQTGMAAGLAVLATIAAARTEHLNDSLVAGYDLSFFIAAGLAVLGMAIVATQISSHACQQELTRQRMAVASTRP